MPVFPRRSIVSRRSQISNLIAYESPAYENWAGLNAPSSLLGRPLLTGPGTCWSLSAYLASSNAQKAWLMVFDYAQTRANDAQPWSTTPTGLGVISPILLTPGVNTPFWDFKQFRRMQTGLFVAISSSDLAFELYSPSLGPGAMFVVDHLGTSAVL